MWPLSAKVNPNLLDNWYFGTPVDQRGGYIVPPGVIADLNGDASVVITTDTYYTVTKINGGYAQFIYSDGQTYNTLLSGCIRGYTGIGYSIDRWKNCYPSGTITLSESGLTFSSMKWFIQFLEHGEELINRTITGSILLADGRFFCGSVVFNGSNMQLFGFDNNYFEITTGGDGSGTDLFGVRFVTYAATDDVTVVAVKLELGNKQTLAHQDSNGNWILNEIPNYGEELTKCQRYQFVPFFSGTSAYPLGIGVANKSTNIFVTISLPTTMRTRPSLNINPSSIWIVSESAQHPTSVAISGHAGNNILFAFTGTFTPGSSYVVYAENITSKGEFILDSNL